MVLDDEGLGESLLYERRRLRLALAVLRHHPGGEAELPAPDPAGIIGEFHISHEANPVPHRDAQLIPGQQRPLPAPLLHDVPRELVAAPRVFSGGKVAVDDDDLHLDRVGESSGDPVAIEEHDLEGTAVRVRDLRAGEDRERQPLREGQAEGGGARRRRRVAYHF